MLTFLASNEDCSDKVRMPPELQKSAGLRCAAGRKLSTSGGVACRGEC